MWYLISSIIGWLTFPLAFRFFRALPDRGYSISRALGLLLWGYFFWLLASFKMLRNNEGSLLLTLILFTSACLYVAYRLNKDEMRLWWQSRRGFVLVHELLYLLCFIGWAFVRGTNPEAAGTEKPMELAFINAILSSPTFPPHDPWLSGYSISYYYFGYILVAMLAKISATPGGVAFNLGISLVFALSASGAYGLVYNLLAHRNTSARSNELPGSFTQSLAALFGPLFVLLVSNLEGFLHVLHTRGVFWTRDISGQLVSGFWKWLDLKDLNIPPTEPFSWIPNRFWWWWRASRVLQDYDLAGNPKEIIDEFPFFSYLLADLHPHVLAMPFAFLAITMALNAFSNTEQGVLGLFHWRINFRSVAWGALLLIPLSVFTIGFGVRELNFLQAGVGILLLVLAGFTLLRMWDTLSEFGSQILIRGDLGAFAIGRRLHIEPVQFLLAAIVLGGMAFLNTWDFPLYVGLFSAAHALGLVLTPQTDLRDRFKEFLWLSLCLGIAGGILFLPFYLGFSSQVGGIIPNLIYVTRGAHLWVMFAPLLVPILAFLIYHIAINPHRKHLLLKGLKWSMIVVGGLWVFALLIGLLIVSIDLLVPNAGRLFQATLASTGAVKLFQAAFIRRMTSPGGWITLLIILALTVAMFRRLVETLREQAFESQTEIDVPFNPSLAFTLLMILFGSLLVLGPEFFFLQDQFGWRMNTIFKFYYQAWLIWGVAAAYATAYLLANLRRLAGGFWRLGLTILLGMSLVYPVLSLWSKTNGLQTREWTLDSSIYLERQYPDEMAAVGWLKKAPPGIIAEAVPAGGGSYTSYALISTQTGIPTVLGWYGHESQWRGGGELLSPRQNDLVKLFCSRDWEETNTILDQYQIRYVVVGNLEREAYHAGENNCPAGLIDTKFSRFLKPVFQQGLVTIYEYAQVNAN